MKRFWLIASLVIMLFSSITLGQVKYSNPYDMESGVWNSLKEKDIDGIKQAFHPQAAILSDSGQVPLSDCLAMISRDTKTVLEVKIDRESFLTRDLGNGIVNIYKVLALIEVRERQFVEIFQCNSVWEKKDGKYQIIEHQQSRLLVKEITRDRPGVEKVKEHIE